MTRRVSRPWPFDAPLHEEPTEKDRAILDATERGWRRGFESSCDVHQPAVEKVRSIRKGGEKGRERQRDDRARDRDRLVAAVEDVRSEHPRWSRLRIARELVAEHGREPDRADPRDYDKRVEALRKRIERAEARR